MQDFSVSSQRLDAPPPPQGTEKLAESVGKHFLHSSPLVCHQYYQQLNSNRLFLKFTTFY